MWDDIDEVTTEEQPPSARPGYQPQTGTGFQKTGWQGGKGNYPKKQWNGGGGFQKSMRKVWTEKDIDISSTQLYLPVAISINNDAPDLSKELESLTKRFNDMHITVRVDGAEGQAEYFEKNALNTEIHLPWKGFGDKESKFSFNPDEAYYLAKLYTPNYESIKEGARIFLARNVRLVMGKNLQSPALFLVCWTKDGCEHARDRNMSTGFAGLPIAVASALKIPVFNLSNPGAVNRINAYLD